MSAHYLKKVIRQKVRSGEGHKKPFHRNFGILKRQQGLVGSKKK